MYSLPSASQIRAPCPRTMNGASHSTALKARTGEFTPPGMSLAARSCRRRDSTSFRGMLLPRELEPRGVAPRIPRAFLSEARLSFSRRIHKYSSDYDRNVVPERSRTFTNISPGLNHRETCFRYSY